VENSENVEILKVIHTGVSTTPAFVVVEEDGWNLNDWR
jgi:hypothetical protein